MEAVKTCDFCGEGADRLHHVVVECETIDMRTWRRKPPGEYSLCRDCRQDVKEENGDEGGIGWTRGLHGEGQ